MASGQFTLKSNCRAECIIENNGKVRALATNQGELRVEHLVIAAGNSSHALLKSLKIDLAIYPLKEYRLTLPFPKNENVVPKRSVTDYAQKTVYAKLGDKLRIAAMVDIGYQKSGICTNRIDALKHNVLQTFPHLKGVDKAEVWAGLRPATPEGPPILGRTPYKNLWLNVGHGSLGFTLAAGSAEVIAELITDQRSSINLEGLTLY